MIYEMTKKLFKNTLACINDNCIDGKGLRFNALEELEAVTGALLTLNIMKEKIENKHVNDISMLQ